MRIVVSGEMGAGKSTAARRAMGLLGWDRPAGFFTHWDGAGRGGPALVLETWGGERWTVARRVGGEVAPGGVPYVLDAAAFCEGVEAGWRGAAPDAPAAIDELGLMEWTVPAAAERVVRRLQGAGPTLAVIQLRAWDRWRAVLGGDWADRVAMVEPEGRGAWPARLADWFGFGKERKWQ